MTIFKQINPVVSNINQATQQHDRFGRERVLAFVLQSEGFYSSIKRRKIGLEKRQNEKISATINRIKHITFSYRTLDAQEIIKVLDTLHPAKEYRIRQQTKQANCLTTITCGSKPLGELFDVLKKFENPPPENRQAGCLRINGWGKDSNATFSLLLQEHGIDPDISRAEVEYFREQAKLAMSSTQ